MGAGDIARSAYGDRGHVASQQLPVSRRRPYPDGRGGGQGRRLEKARAELALLETFRPAPLPQGGRIAVGAVVEIEDEDSGEGRTFFLAPVGAGLELTMPEGDGFLSVVTPNSPIGRAVLNRRRGDSVEVSVEGETRYWKIAWVE